MLIYVFHLFHVNFQGLKYTAQACFKFKTHGTYNAEFSFKW